MPLFKCNKQDFNKTPCKHTTLIITAPGADAILKYRVNHKRLGCYITMHYMLDEDTNIAGERVTINNDGEEV